MKFSVQTDWSDGVPRAVGCFTTDEGKRLNRGELEHLGRLFLAAPELLALLRECSAALADLLADADPSGLECQEQWACVAECKKAIAKAEGRDE